MIKGKEDSEIKPHSYSHLIFDKGVKNIHTLEERQALQHMVLGKLVIYMQNTETRSLSLTLYKIQLQMIKDTKVMQL
jgi:hypothetical protein